MVENAVIPFFTNGSTLPDFDDSSKIFLALHRISLGLYVIDRERSASLLAASGPKGRSLTSLSALRSSPGAPPLIPYVSAD